MKYETPICDVIEIEVVDIICTSGFSNNDEVGDTPTVDL